MSLRRIGIALLAGSLAAAVATVPVSQLGKRHDQSPRPHRVSSPKSPATKSKVSEGPTASRKAPGKHSLRAPVTDENFYFVMADRFENGGHRQRHRRNPGGPKSMASTPPTRASTTAATSGGCWTKSTTSRDLAPPRSG